MTTPEQQAELTFLESLVGKTETDWVKQQIGSLGYQIVALHQGGERAFIDDDRGLVYVDSFGAMWAKS